MGRGEGIINMQLRSWCKIGLNKEKRLKRAEY